MTPTRAQALGRQRYPSGPRTGRIHAAVPATSGMPQWAPGGRAYQTHRTHGRKISCIRLYLSLGAVRGRAAPRCDPLRLSPRLGRICVSDTFVFALSLGFFSPKKKTLSKCLPLVWRFGSLSSRRAQRMLGRRAGGFFLCLEIFSLRMAGHRVPGGARERWDDDSPE